MRAAERQGGIDGRSIVASARQDSGMPRKGKTFGCFRGNGYTCRSRRCHEPPHGRGFKCLHPSGGVWRNPARLPCHRRPGRKTIVPAQGRIEWPAVPRRGRPWPIHGSGLADPAARLHLSPRTESARSIAAPASLKGHTEERRRPEKRRNCDEFLRFLRSTPLLRVTVVAASVQPDRVSDGSAGTLGFLLRPLRSGPPAPSFSPRVNRCDEGGAPCVTSSSPTPRTAPARPI